MLISVNKKAVVEFAILFTIKLSFYFLSINLKGFKLHENVMVRKIHMKPVKKLETYFFRSPFP